MTTKENRQWKVIGAALCAWVLLFAGALTAQSSSSSRGKGEKANPTAAKAGAKDAKEVRAARGDEILPSDLAEYTIGEQDVLAITVWREAELSGPVVVRPDGKITLPLVNEVAVLGMKPSQLQLLLTEKLRPFLAVPQVTVAVREINSRRVYVIGQVGREGSYRINSTMTILQIIAEAGGLREFANRKKIYLLRNESGKQVRYPFNYDDVIQGKNYTQNISLKPGDTIVVP